MGTVQEIEDAVLKLSGPELATFRAWFAEYDAAAWDRQIEEDAAEGRLDALADDVIANCQREYGGLPTSHTDCCVITRGIRPCTSRKSAASGPSEWVCTTEHSLWEHEDDVVWFWIGPHTEYNRLLGLA